MNTKNKTIVILITALICGALSGCLTSEELDISIPEKLDISTQKPVEFGPFIIEKHNQYNESIGPELPKIVPELTKLLLELPESTPETLILPDYYNITIEQSFIDYKLYNYLKQYTWGRPVNTGMWSFREAAELEHKLTEKGCNVKIRWADCKSTISHTDFEERVLCDDYLRSGCQPELDQVSCWLMIELNDEWVAYSPTHCYWIFKPECEMKDEYTSGGKWHNWWYYEEGKTAEWYGDTWTSYNFIDFNDIYEIEEYYMNGKMQNRDAGKNKDGIWWNYVNSEEYSTSDDFLISFGWWLTEEERREIETRINKATNWFTLIE